MLVGKVGILFIDARAFVGAEMPSVDCIGKL